MDVQNWAVILRVVLEGFGSVLLLLLTAIVRSLRNKDMELGIRITEQNTKFDTLAKELEESRLHLAEDYVKKSDFRDALTEVKTSIDGLRTLLVDHFKSLAS